MTPAMAEEFLRTCPYKDDIALCGHPQIQHSGEHSSQCTVWFEMWDSKAGTQLKKLVGKRVYWWTKNVTFKAATERKPVMFCQRCWRWKHTAAQCPSKWQLCPLCGEKHDEKSHCPLASCCRGLPKATPPVPATPAGEPCPHDPKCVNCGLAHASHSRSCKFWSHRFNEEWISSAYQRVRTRRGSSHTLYTKSRTPLEC
jgi:hypothetical protein